MRNKIFSSFIIILLLGAIYSSNKLFQSSIIQSYLMWDFNNESYNLPYELYTDKSRLDDNYPNLTLTALPIKFMKARYFFAEDSIKVAKGLAKKAIKDNPYIKGPEALLAQIYFNEKEYDSSLFYSRDAFYSLPNVNAHRYVYFKNLVYQKDSIELDNAFNMIRNFNNPNHWYEYFTSRYAISDSSSAYLLELLDEFKVLFPNEKKSKVDDVTSFIKVGSQQYSLSFLIAESAMAEYENQNYDKSIELFESAIVLNPDIYTFYENAALAYTQLMKYEKAIEYYDKVINYYESEDGKSEYLRGLLNIQLGSEEEGCGFLKKSIEKKYTDASGISARTVFSRFCINQN